MPASVDLDRYLERIGHAGPLRADRATLDALTREHAQAIAFENLDVFLHRPIPLAPEALFAKLVTRGRGGYCFEQNGLFLAVLRAVGFRVTPLRAAVRFGTPDRSVALRHSHLALHVEVGGERWLTDVGIGSASLTCALALVPDRVQETPHDQRRLERAGGLWYHQMRRAGEWVDVYAFGGEPLRAPDREMANWWTSAHPESNFRHELIAARPRPDGSRVSLSGGRLRHYAPDGSLREQLLPDAAHQLAALRTDFGLALTPADAAALSARLAAACPR